MATRYATSKITSLEDVYNGTGLTMGFRGEALFSMACVSDRLVVATRTADEELATKLVFGRDGRPEGDSEPISRKVGTTVAVVRPFGSLPARRADLTRRIRGERTKIFKLLEAYGIFHVGVCLNLIDITSRPNGGGSREETALATSASSTTLQETASSILGPKFVRGMQPVDISLEPILQRIYGENLYDWGIRGLVSTEPGAAAATSTSSSSASSGGATRMVQYYSINGRVVDLPKVTALLKRLWATFGGKKKPSALLALTLPNDAFDINLSPDKQTVLLTHEQDMMGLIEEYMTRLWSNQGSAVFAVQKGAIGGSITSRGLGDADAASDNDDDSCGEAGDGERQMHKRRFAFVHDLSKAQMQHDLAERRMFGDGNHEVDGDDPQSQTRHSDEDGGHPTNKKARVSLDSSGRVDDTTSMPNEQHPNDEADASSPRTSDMERIQWNEIQAKFRRGEIDDENVPTSASTSSEENDTSAPPPSAPASPEDVRTGQSLRNGPITGSLRATRSETKSTVNHLATNSESNEGTTETPATTKPATRSTRQSILQQFAFQPAVKDKVENNKKRITRSNNRPPHGILIPSKGKSSEKPGEEAETDPSELECNQDILDDTTTTIATDDDAASKELKSSPPLLPRPDLEDRAGCSSPQNGARDKAGAQPSSGDPTVSTTRRQYKRTESTEQPDAEGETVPQVIWDSYVSTEHVCQSARLERLQMRKRKRSIDKIRRMVSQSADPDTSLEQAVQPGANGPIPNEDDGSVGHGAFDEGGSDEFSPSASSSASFIRMSKSTFRDGMQVIGQFNLGFILVKCANNHLWILDQHSCDERYNFEQLCKKTKIHEQPLFKPLPLELSPIEEACVLDHMDIFQANGFRFAFDAAAPIRHRLSLTALPHSGAQEGRRAVQFGPSDVSALCSILIEGSSYDPGGGGTGTDGSGKYGNNAVRRHAAALSGPGQGTTADGTAGGADRADRILARLPKAIAMFASRACRTSVMIGTALSQREMESVVQKLADVDQPFTCAHGRPTMRHVGNLLPMLWSDERRAAEHIAGPTVTMTPMTQQEEADP
jgi:DNA mismatch repair protein PMS2